MSGNYAQLMMDHVQKQQECIALTRQLLDVRSELSAATRRAITRAAAEIGKTK